MRKHQKNVNDNCSLNVTNPYIGHVKDRADIKVRQSYNIGSGEG